MSAAIVRLARRYRTRHPNRRANQERIARQLERVSAGYL